MTVRQPGATYVSSSSTDRPLLILSGWKDYLGQPLGAAGAVRVGVQVRVVSESGAAQSALIYPSFAQGRSEYALPLWPFTQGMDPHVGTYTLEWRTSPFTAWEVIDTLTMDVRLPEPTAASTLSYADGTLTGTGWAFDRSTNIGGSFKVALNVTDTEGNTTPVIVRARFSGTRFTVTDAALEAAGAPVASGYTIAATSSNDTACSVSVRIPGAEPTVEP
ncbi:hypothetical protein, partial [Actinomyces sp. MRS3W]|uniref:hypothetical protein n=1 Tax=Actinomyces sp. MRS3W TaxID=2800796 RepID=UPI0028FD2CA2